MYFPDSARPPWGSAGCSPRLRGGTRGGDGGLLEVGRDGREQRRGRWPAAARGAPPEKNGRHVNTSAVSGPCYCLIFLVFFLCISQSIFRETVHIIQSTDG